MEVVYTKKEMVVAYCCTKLKDEVCIKNTKKIRETC